MMVSKDLEGGCPDLSKDTLPDSPFLIPILYAFRYNISV